MSWRSQSLAQGNGTLQEGCHSLCPGLAEFAHATVSSRQRSHAAPSLGGPHHWGLCVKTCCCHTSTPLPSSSSHGGSSSALHQLHGPSATLGLPVPHLPMLAGQAGARQGPRAAPRQGVSWQHQPAACLGNAGVQVHPPSSVFLASSMVVPPQGSVLLILSFLPRGQQHNLLPALQGNALEAPRSGAGNPSLCSDRGRSWLPAHRAPKQR